MMYSLTVFDSLYDNTTEKHIEFETWEKFEKLLYDLSKMPYKSKKDATLISPASYKPETTRANDNVTEWGSWAALDIDSHDVKGDLKEELYDKYGNYYYVCYSTASSTDARPKYRLVFPLQRRVANAEIKNLWYALNKEFNEMGDAQTKDLSRMYYVPGSYAGANNFIFTNVGKKLDVDGLIRKHPMPEKKNDSLYDNLPPAMRDMVLKYRQQKLTNTHYTWTSYEDCPFMNKEMIDDFKRIAFTDGSGRYSAVYSIMVSIASRAVKMGYPINETQIIELVRELDRDTANRYQKRRLDIEAKRALRFAMNGL